MPSPPVTRDVQCPECGATAWAIVPKYSKIIQQVEDRDGKVWVNCSECEERFPVHYKIES